MASLSLLLSLSLSRYIGSCTHLSRCLSIDVNYETDPTSGPLKFGVKQGGSGPLAGLTAAEIETFVRLKFILLVDVHFLSRCCCCCCCCYVWRWSQ